MLYDVENSYTKGAFTQIQADIGHHMDTTFWIAQENKQSNGMAGRQNDICDRDFVNKIILCLLFYVKS